MSNDNNQEELEVFEIEFYAISKGGEDFIKYIKATDTRALSIKLLFGGYNGDISDVEVERILEKDNKGAKKYQDVRVNLGILEDVYNNKNHGINKIYSPSLNYERLFNVAE